MYILFRSWDRDSDKLSNCDYRTPTLYTLHSAVFTIHRKGPSSVLETTSEFETQYYNVMYIVLFNIYAYKTHRVHSCMTIILFLVLGSRSLCIIYIFSFVCTTNWLIYFKFETHPDKFKNEISYLCILWGFYLLYKDDIHQAYSPFFIFNNRVV